VFRPEEESLEVSKSGSLFNWDAVEGDQELVVSASSAESVKLGLYDQCGLGDEGSTHRVGLSISSWWG
jgi:hypothetical protein